MTAHSETQPEADAAHSEPSDSQLPVRKIVVLGTGGTIACTHDPSGALIPTISTEELVAPIGARFTDGNVIVEGRDLNRLDSSALQFEDYDDINAAIAEALSDPEVAGVVITHGTDSMEETAMAIDVFHNDPRPVVLTGAQLPADHPNTDGPTNLFESVVIAMDPSARDIGVLIVFGHAVIPARGATKWHTSDELAFATNAPEDPVRPDPLARVPLAGHRVDIIPAYPGADSTLVDAALAAGAEGLVIEGMGAGNVGPILGKAIAGALDQGVPVVMSTRVPRGDVHGSYGGAGGGLTLARKGVIGSGCVHAAQARIILAAAIASGVHPQTLFEGV